MTSARRCGYASSRNLEKIRNPERLASWLATTARNEAIRTKRIYERTVPTAVEFQVLDTDPAVDAGLLASERDAEVAAAFATLDEDCQLLLRAVTADPPLDYQTIADHDRSPDRKHRSHAGSLPRETAPRAGSNPAIGWGGRPGKREREMNPTTHEPDEALAAELAAALEATDPVPERFVEAAKESFTWRTIDAELAELIFDSPRANSSESRGVDGTRQVTFQAPGVEIEVAIISDGSRRLVGQLVPAVHSHVELHFGDQAVVAESDDLGRFLSRTSRWPHQHQGRTRDGATIQTAWTLV